MAHANFWLLCQVHLVISYKAVVKETLGGAQRFLTMKSRVPSSKMYMKNVHYSSHPRQKLVACGTQVPLD